MYSLTAESIHQVQPSSYQSVVATLLQFNGRAGQPSSAASESTSYSKTETRETIPSGRTSSKAFRILLTPRPLSSYRDSGSIIVRQMVSLCPKTSPGGFLCHPLATIHSVYRNSGLTRVGYRIGRPAQSIVVPVHPGSEIDLCRSVSSPSL